MRWRIFAREPSALFWTYGFPVVLALVLGPLLLCAGLLLVILDLRGVNAHGWPEWSRRLHAALWLGLGNLILGWRILHAARTGVDPYDESGGEHTSDGERDSE